MVYYSAESVIAQLKANNTLECEGIDEVGCPSPAPCSITHEKRECKSKKGLPCDICVNQACDQWVIIRTDKYKKMGMLMFKFVFPTHPRGRIPQKDSHFLRIKKLIDESKLETC